MTYPNSDFQDKKSVGELLLALLIITCKHEEFTVDDLVEKTRFSKKKVIQEITKPIVSNLINFHYPIIQIDKRKRLSLALEALKAGIYFERICRSLSYREFEDITGEALRANSFKTLTRFILKHKRKKYEIDLIAKRDSLIICADCKHWRHSLSPSRLSLAVKKQVERTNALATELKRYEPRLGIKGQSKISFIPAVITLADTNIRAIQKVPIIPVLRLGNFLSEFDLYLNRLLVITPKPDSQQATLGE